MRLPPPPPTYDPQDQAQTRAEIAREDANNVKKTDAPTSFFITDTDTGEIVTLTVESGVLVVT